MKPFFVFFALVLPSVGLRAQLVVTDPGQSAIHKLKATADAKHQAFMNTQMMKDAIVLKNTFVQAEKYYTWVDEKSKSRGGLVGYYRQMAEDEVDSFIEDEKQKFIHEGTNVTGRTLVNDIAVKASKEAEAALSKGINAAGRPVDSAFKQMDRSYGDSNTEWNDALQQQSIGMTAGFKVGLEASELAAKRIEAANKEVGGLLKTMQSIERESANPRLTDKQHDSIMLSQAAIQSRLGVAQYKVTVINAELVRKMIDGQNINAAIARQASASYQRFTLRNLEGLRGKPGTEKAAVAAELKRMPR
ncbi:MAG: hypothetical protein A2V88_09215 [Elusimicrobia bacterium RBG_16_66_12]|nr:MAG: hypothetical protein A2V88_09215 [Elusimicrobia bacterium RBG_16_66_12]